MVAISTYLKRKRERERAGQADVYKYDEVPSFLRKQVRMVLDASLGRWVNNLSLYGDSPPNGNHLWQQLADSLEREIEAFPGREDNARDRFVYFIDYNEVVDEWLSGVEMACRLLDILSAHEQAVLNRRAIGATQRSDEALEEINARFRENAFGYEYKNGEIIRIDDQFAHAEMVKPAINLLARKGFERANEEFMLAHKHYREGNNKDSIVAANRAFEATLKATCVERGWKYPDGARAAELVTAIRNNGLFPDFLDGGLNTYVALMKTGLPNVRNNAGGHGEDPSAPIVESYLASYAIHTTAANILLVMNALVALPKR